LNLIGIVGRDAKRIEKQQISLSILINEIKKQQKILNKEKPDTTKLNLIVNDYNDITNKVSHIERIIGDLKLIQNRITNLKIEQKNADKELEKQTEGICPICGGKL